MLSRQRLWVAFDSRQLRRHPGLVAHVELQQHGRERFDRSGVRQLTGVERAAPRDLGDDLADGADRVGIVAADQHVRVDRLADRSQLLRRQVVEGGDDPACRNRGLDVGGDAAARRNQRLELLADADEGVGHADHDLAA